MVPNLPPLLLPQPKGQELITPFMDSVLGHWVGSRGREESFAGWRRAWATESCQVECEGFREKIDGQAHSPRVNSKEQDCSKGCLAVPQLTELSLPQRPLGPMLVHCTVATFEQVLGSISLGSGRVSLEWWTQRENAPKRKGRADHSPNDESVHSL